MSQLSENSNKPMLKLQLNSLQTESMSKIGLFFESDLITREPLSCRKSYVFQFKQAEIRLVGGSFSEQRIGTIKRNTLDEGTVTRVVYNVYQEIKIEARLKLDARMNCSLAQPSVDPVEEHSTRNTRIFARQAVEQSCPASLLDIEEEFNELCSNLLNLTFEDRAKLMYGTACGAYHLHINDIVHRNLAATETTLPPTFGEKCPTTLPPAEAQPLENGISPWRTIRSERILIKQEIRSQ